MSTLSNIIVTEDDESLNHLMQKILRREGFKTEGALNGPMPLTKQPAIRTRCCCWIMVCLI